MLLLALLLLAKGGYMHAKAHFAQFLIERAFEQTLVDQKPHKPWSWADTHPVAKMRFYDSHDQIKQKALFVLAGVSGRTLAFGPGLYLAGAHAGELGNTVIAGHRDSHFINLQYLHIGDKIELQNIKGAIIEYQITDLRVVDETQVEELAMTPDERLTLITCYPFYGISANARMRYIVEAKPIKVNKPQFI
ncbi:class GN sortase [Shewanella aestuarii]|uniref:Class GN sortase n=2 Tax=Shewanella aestuarii TaxID=1028752 RepID=A0A6G9QQU7_9GAMM|nr:class GN sortase [Shewanella aestuarii]